MGHIVQLPVTIKMKLEVLGVMFVIFGGGKNATRCICMIAEGILAVSVSF
jgi:hypothetical protein